MKKIKTQNNSFSEFLLYKTPNGNVKVEVFLHDENLWLTQDKIALLFDVQRPSMTKHLFYFIKNGNIYFDLITMLVIIN